MRDWTKEEKKKLLEELRSEFPENGCDCHSQISILMKELEEEE